MPAFVNRPVWSVVEQFANRAVNDLYTAVKVNREGRILPTLVARQIPFTTSVLETDLNVTRFLELPRWKIPGAMIKSFDIGSSDSTRINFVMVHGQASQVARSNPFPNQLIENPPIMDSVDIQRSGLRSYIQTLEVWVDDTIGVVPGKYAQLIADWSIGSHLTQNGSVESLGIVSPIAVGDNIELDGVVFHIEQVSHSAHIRGYERSFTTTLHLTNGMRAERTSSENEDRKFPIYPGLYYDDNVGAEPGYVFEQHETTGGKSREAEFSDEARDPPPEEVGPDGDKAYEDVYDD
jgi:hypothetical protein